MHPTTKSLENDLFLIDSVTENSSDRPYYARKIHNIRIVSIGLELRLMRGVF